MSEMPSGVPDKPDLAMVETMDLIKALRARFPKGFLLVTDWLPDDGQVHPVVNYGPDVIRATGLLSFASMQINRDLAQLTKE